MRVTAQGLGARAGSALALAGTLLFVVGAAPAPGASGNGSSGNAAISARRAPRRLRLRLLRSRRRDTNAVYDVFVRDRLRRTTERVSLGAGGVQANARTGLAAMSADGRFVLMRSDASNLVAGDTNGAPDLFLRDRVAQTTERVSVGTGGAQANGDSAQGDVSADGQIVAFASAASNLGGGDGAPGFNVFVRDRAKGTTEFVGAGWDPALSGDGRFVAFDARNGAIRVRDRALGTTEDVSVSDDGERLPGDGAVPTISADGRFVAFLMDVQRPRRAPAASFTSATGRETRPSGSTSTARETRRSARTVGSWWRSRRRRVCSSASSGRRRPSS